MKKYYSLYLFDFDLTLVDTTAVIVKCFHKTMAAMGFPRKNDKNLARLIGLPMNEAVGIALNTQDKDLIDRFCHTYTEIADRYMTAGTHFYPETLPALQKLRENGAKIGIVSSKTASRIDEKLQKSRCQHLIDHVIGCQEHPLHRRPSGRRPGRRSRRAGFRRRTDRQHQQLRFPRPATQSYRAECGTYSTYPQNAICPHNAIKLRNLGFAVCTFRYRPF